MAQDYTAKGQSLDQILEAIESDEFGVSYGGKSTLALEAAVAAAAARAQAKWTMIASVAAVGSFIAALAAVLVAALR
jgi:hypothetical protein